MKRTWLSNILRGNLLLVIFFVTGPISAQEVLYQAENSVARNWNEALLFAIRNDFARPTVHARNLYHTSALMYDIWSIYDDKASTVFLGEATQLDACKFDLSKKKRIVAQSIDLSSDRATAISYGMYALLTRRFINSPGSNESQSEFIQMANAFNVDRSINLANSKENSPQQLGLYVANCLKSYGELDGSNQHNDYVNTTYQAINTPLDPSLLGNPNIVDSDRWQPLSLDIFIDQSGNLTNTPEFLGAEWGRVLPFALTKQELTIYQRSDVDYWVYHDPGVPAYLTNAPALPNEYQWGHSLVLQWSSHLEPTDGVMIDISPASIGNTLALPQSIQNLPSFYQTSSGGSIDRGRLINPVTNSPYQKQIIPRGDYTRVLAEFWADGPNSETPPGHWFTILNESVSDHLLFEKRYQGQGVVLNNLEWDVKAYLALGGALHDAAISAWGVKGWYDSIRPISAIRHMAELGQSSDSNENNYHPNGLPLMTDMVAIVRSNDALAGRQGQHVGEIKVYAWRGPEYINGELNAGVGWILAKNWWPYQRASFVTPSFAGYVSGHSTFSRAAAEVLTLITGNEYFPGGIAEFIAKKDEFLTFEKGPSVDVRLQWATFKDASDQSGLSRIWGGIHPPGDDVPGRRIGIQVGQQAFSLAELYFNGEINMLPDPVAESTLTSEPAELISSASSAGGGITFIVLLLLNMIFYLSRRFKKTNLIQ